MKFRAHLNERINITKSGSMKYFKLIQKSLKASSFEVSGIENGMFQVTFFNTEEFSKLTLLLKNKEKSNKIGVAKIIGYSLNGGESFEKIPAMFTSMKDVISSAKLFKSFDDNKSVAAKKLKSYKGGVDLEADLISFLDEDAKYTLQKEGKYFRIFALKTIKGVVSRGQMGGLIESESNLSHRGDCWVYENGLVCEKAQVVGNAKIKGGKVCGKAVVRDNSVIDEDAKIFGSSIVMDNSMVFGEARIFDNVVVGDNAKIHGYVVAYGSAQIYGDAEMFGHSQAYDEASIYGSAKVYGRAKIFGFSKVYERAEVFEKAQVSDIAEIHGSVKLHGKVKVSGNADLSGNEEYFGKSVIEFNF